MPRLPIHRPPPASPIVILRLDPRTQEERNEPMKGGSVYILASKRNGTLYTGVTSDLAGRVWEHRTAAVPGFTKRYGVKMLVWFAEYADIRNALAEVKTDQAVAASLEDQVD